MNFTIRTSFDAGHPTRLSSALRGVAILCLIATSVASLAAAQDSTAKYPTWSKLEESRDTKSYKDSLRETGTLEESAREFLERMALPQLARQENRSTIERTRRRMRELLLDPIDDEDEKALNAANRTVLDYMVKLAGDSAAEPVVRVNAILLVGDLQSRDRKPWKPASKPLASTAGNRKMPMAVRIASLAGLARHVEAARSGRDDDSAALAEIVEPVVAAILEEQAGSGARVEGRRSVEADWIAARAAMMLPSLNRPASKNVAAALARMIDDPARGLDTRIRAAATLGATADASSQIDAGKSIDSIRALAVMAVENDLGMVEHRRFEEEHRSLADGKQDDTDSAAGSAIPVQVCRRAAWRLTTLADAVLTADAAGGLARLGGNAGDAAATLAASLRSGGMALDEHPDARSLDEALAGLLQRPADGRPGREQPAAERPAPEQPKPAEPAPSPFEASPFGN